MTRHELWERLSKMASSWWLPTDQQITHSLTVKTPFVCNKTSRHPHLIVFKCAINTLCLLKPALCERSYLSTEIRPLHFGLSRVLRNDFAIVYDLVMFPFAKEICDNYCYRTYISSAACNVYSLEYFNYVSRLILLRRLYF